MWQTTKKTKKVQKSRKLNKRAYGIVWYRGRQYKYTGKNGGSCNI